MPWPLGVWWQVISGATRGERERTQTKNIVMPQINCPTTKNNFCRKQEQFSKWLPTKRKKPTTKKQPPHWSILSSPLRGGGILFSSEGEPRQRQGKWLAHGHRVNLWQSPKLNPKILMPSPIHWTTPPSFLCAVQLLESVAVVGTKTTLPHEGKGKVSCWPAFERVERCICTYRAALEKHSERQFSEYNSVGREFTLKTAFEDGRELF